MSRRCRLLTPGATARYGGRLRLALGGLTEVLFSILLAPVVALRVTLFLAGLVLGRSVIWGGQRRDAYRLGWDKDEQQRIYYMGLLHDIGKIGIPEAILRKTSRLTDEEYDIIKQHTIIGYNILNYVAEFPELKIGARWHHERYDGTGYPDGLKSDTIPVYARIIAVADTYDAMTSKRSYRDILPQDVVRKEIEKASGKQLDPKYTDIMILIIDSDKDYRLHEQ